MGITETRDVKIADVSVTDDYRVELEQEDEFTVYTPEQARDLAQLLIDNADAAETLEHADARAAFDQQECRAANGEVVL